MRLRHLYMQAYTDYFEGKLLDHQFSHGELTLRLKELADYPEIS